MYVQSYDSFLQPPVYYFLNVWFYFSSPCPTVWQRDMTARAMMISLLKTLQQFGERRQTAACETTRRKEGTKKKRETKKCKTAMFGVILSPGPDVVLALLFRSLCRENTLWSRQFEWLWASAKTRLRLAFLTVCLVLRVSELGRFTIENPVKGFSRKCAWNVTRRGWRN